jgi:prevent-host-death family protein
MARKRASENLKMSAAEARGRFAEVINRVAFGKDRVLLKRRNRPLAAVVPLEDIELLEELEERADLQASRRAREEVRRKGTIPWKRLKKELGLRWGGAAYAVKIARPLSAYVTFLAQSPTWRARHQPHCDRQILHCGDWPFARRRESRWFATR